MKKIITLLFLLILGMNGSITLAESSQNDTYSVSPVFSEHQTKGVESFFDIRWTPAFTERFEVLITNHSDTSKTYQIQVNKARTNRNGIIDYSDSTPESKTIKYQLTKMIQLPKEVTVPARQSQKVEGTLKFPPASFNGILIAGIHVSEKEIKSDQSTVSNTVSYNIPFVVRGNNDVRPKPKLELKKVSLQYFSSTQSSLDVQLSNQKTTFLKESYFQAKIRTKKGKVITTQSSKIDLTPETDFVYPVKLPKDLPVGEYELVLKVKHENDQWQFKQSFHITDKEAKDIRQRAGVKYDFWFLYILPGLGIVIAIVAILIIIYTRKKGTQNEDRRSKHEKR